MQVVEAKEQRPFFCPLSEQGDDPLDRQIAELGELPDQFCPGCRAQPEQDADRLPVRVSCCIMQIEGIDQDTERFVPTQLVALPAKDPEPGTDLLESLSHQPGFPNPGLAFKQNEFEGPLGRALEGGDNPGQLAVASYQRWVIATQVIPLDSNQPAPAPIRD